MEILDLVGLAHLADRRVAGLPYGTMKNVEMAAVLATDPEILMLDEPSSGMGPEEAHVLGDTLLQLRKELGLTILMIEHHVPLVVRVCDHVYCLNFGQLLTEGDPDSVRSHPEVVSAYLGEEA
jgi:branched-chain amino acid transport system ATP-binding protein